MTNFAAPLLLSLLAAAAEPEQRELLKTFRAEFVELTPGTGKFPAAFVQGRKEGGAAAERPPRKVALMAPFAICRYEVPQNLYEAVTGKNPSRWKGPRNSVEMVSFEEAVAFCEQATRLLREEKLIGPEQAVRLPTESEWEYAARAGTTTVYSFGDDEASLGEFGWYTGNAAGNDPPVGAKKPNPWGLYDMHGYLWEWCLDRWHDSYEGAPADGLAWMEAGDAARRVVRGGSWKDAAARCTSSFRVGLPRDARDDAVGFRCVLAGP